MSGAWRYLSWALQSLIWLPLGFKLDGMRYRYFSGWHNTTWRNERCVEIPVVWDLVRDTSPERTLEVGNVLANYFDCRHAVLDKFEEGARILNEDVEYVDLPQKYDLIVSISTLEHVGWDETRYARRSGGEASSDERKGARAVKNLVRHLAAGGLLVFTIPSGYNPHMDRALQDDVFSLSRRLCLKRISRWNLWREATPEEIEGLAFNGRYRAAGGVSICFIRADGSR